MSWLPSSFNVTAPGASPSRSALVLHGILGAGGNWRSFAKRWVTSYPSWELTLVDLRNHGNSTNPPGPQDLASCGADLLRLEQSLDKEFDLVCGHSFGGKVALEFARQKGASALRQVWVLDSVPGPRSRDSDPESVRKVLQVLRALPPVLPSRKALVEHCVHHGLARAIGLWQTTNLEPTDGGYRLKLGLDAIDSLLDSFAATDYWPLLENAPQRIDFIQAENSMGWKTEEIDALAELASRRQDRGFHLLEDSAHWVHTDNPDGLLLLMAPTLTAATPSTPSRAEPDPLLP